MHPATVKFQAPPPPIPMGFAKCGGVLVEKDDDACPPRCLIGYPVTGSAAAATPGQHSCWHQYTGTVRPLSTLHSSVTLNRYSPALSQRGNRAPSPDDVCQRVRAKVSRIARDRILRCSRSTSGLDNSRILLYSLKYGNVRCRDGARRTRPR
jgi:hypothetical protein